MPSKFTADDWRSGLAALPAGPWRTRFAPAPTGWLHLGHLVNAIHVWGVARAHGGTVLLRVEDHDRTRCRREYEQGLLDDLDWLGLRPDLFDTASFRAQAGAPEAPHASRQSDRLATYEAALSALTGQGRVYVCRCSRREIDQLAPHAEGDEPRYPGTCRTRQLSPAESFVRRVLVDDRVMAFTDLRLGRMAQQPSAQCGDLIIRDRHAQWSYQFGVTVDDMAQEIDVVIRGEDLLASTGRQLLLASLLGRTRPLHFLHHPLVRHADGRKLSKANRDTALRDLREAGASAESLLGEAAFRSGLQSTTRSIAAVDLAALFVP